MSKKNLGSSIDDFLKKEGIFEEAQAKAIKEVAAWQAKRDRLPPTAPPSSPATRKPK
jgi:hypothetical protein